MCNAPFVKKNSWKLVPNFSIKFIERVGTGFEEFFLQIYGINIMMAYLSCGLQISLADWFHFMWDRLRGIRKDITQQALCCAGNYDRPYSFDSFFL